MSVNSTDLAGDCPRHFRWSATPPVAARASRPICRLRHALPLPRQEECARAGGGKEQEQRGHPSKRLRATHLQDANSAGQDPANPRTVAKPGQVDYQAMLIFLGIFLTVPMDSATLVAAASSTSRTWCAGQIARRRHRRKAFPPKRATPESGLNVLDSRQSGADHLHQGAVERVAGFVSN